MPHFFISSNNANAGALTVNAPETVHHIANVLRVKTGETVKFIDQNEIQYITKITGVSKKEIRAEIIKSEKSTRKLKHNIYLAQSVLKNEAQGLLISNAAQLGIKGVYPFISDYSTAKKTAGIRCEKWQKIADEAFKQCERADKMQVFNALSLNEILSKFKKENIIIFAEKDSNCKIFEAVQDIKDNSEILIVIGPEGGFSDMEFDFFKNRGYKMVSLGNLIFKAPNAVTAGAANVIFALDLKDQISQNKPQRQ